MSAAPRARKQLMWVAVVACAGILAIGLLSSVIPNPGVVIFDSFLIGGIFLALRASNGLSAELVEDRRNEMFSLIFVSGVKASDLFLAKLSVRAQRAIYPTLAMLPCLMISILYGGVSVRQYLVATFLIPTAILFFAGFEFLGAAVKTESGAADQFAARAKAVALAWPWLVNWVAEAISGAPLSLQLNLFSPASVILSLWDGMAFPGEFSDVIATLGTTVGLSLAVLFASGRILERGARKAMGEQKIRRERRTGWGWPEQIRPHLDFTPALWLAAFDREAIGYAWTTVLIILGVWFAGLLIWGSGWLCPAVFYAASLAIIWSVRTQMLLRAARRMARMRRDGELELLLTTPLEAELIAESESEAILLQFRPLASVVRSLTIIFMLAATFFHPWNNAGLLVHIVISAILISASSLRPRGAIANYIWIALNTGQGSGAVFRRLAGSSVGFTWASYHLIRGGLRAVRTFPEGTGFEIFLCIILALFYGGIVLSQRQTGKTRRALLERHFREIARTPLPPADVIKTWNGEKPLAHNRILR